MAISSRLSDLSIGPHMPFVPSQAAEFLASIMHMIIPDSTCSVISDAQQYLLADHEDKFRIGHEVNSVCELVEQRLSKVVVQAIHHTSIRSSLLLLFGWDQKEIIVGQDHTIIDVSQ